MQIDHVEVFVPDRYEAAGWYADVLGLEILKQHEHWADEGGPLMISPDAGNTMVALFEGQRRNAPDVDADGIRAGLRRIAFRVDASAFKDFLANLETMELFASSDRSDRVKSSDVVDHDKAWSIYFCDPYGNKLEVTTYDYEEVKKTMSENSPGPPL